LKLLQFVNAARSFGNVGSTVEVFGQLLLDRASLFEIVIIVIWSIAVGVSQGFHGDDGVCAAELVFVFYGHASPFDDAPDGGFAGLVSLAVTTTGSLDEGGLHGEGVVRAEVLVGVEFGRKRLEISVQSLAAFLEFEHAEGGGLEGVREGAGLHGDMDGGVGSQAGILVDLSLDASLQGAGQFLAQVVPSSHISVLFESGFISTFVHHVSPVAWGAYRSQFKV